MPMMTLTLLPEREALPDYCRARALRSSAPRALDLSSPRPPPSESWVRCSPRHPSGESSALSSYSAHASSSPLLPARRTELSRAELRWSRVSASANADTDLAFLELELDRLKLESELGTDLNALELSPTCFG